MNIYCGNNQLHSGLTNGTSRIGSRYQCLRKGIGLGRSLPYDKDYDGPFQPIDNTKIYCGNDNVLPPGYDRLGNNSTCLQKGVAIGKVQKAEFRPFLNMMNKKFFILILYLLIIISTFFVLFFTKPTFITKTNTDGTIDIDWYKFSLLYGIIVLVLGIIFFILKKNFYYNNK